MLRFLAFFSINALVIHSQTLPACTSCPPNGIWSDWSDSGSCSATCGLFGTVTQTRTCTSASAGCPCDAANTSRTIACPVSPLCLGTIDQQCMSPYTKWANNDLKKSVCGNVTSSDDYVPPTCTM
ncbi:unnamed protein product, partial [Mesorhabditis belari]|uniref:Uncharacterized protein n=1 Tax=Mesorhabditis belari TaxID=2138241 RepID=A0AAF3FA51_9BILA